MSLPAFMQGEKINSQSLINLDSFGRVIAAEVGATSCKGDVAMIWGPGSTIASSPWPFFLLQSFTQHILSFSSGQAKFKDS